MATLNGALKRSSAKRVSTEANGSSPGAGTSAQRREPALARAVRCDADAIHLTLTNGTTITVPLTERLRNATPEQRHRCRVDDYGTALRWDELDEDLGVAALLGVPEQTLEELAGFVRAR